MYPSLGGDDNTMRRTSFKQHIPPSQAMTNAILELKQNLPSISSFKPHLNTYQCYLSLIINNKISVPLKIVFLRNYPDERPILFVTQWINHPLVNQCSCQVEYEAQFPWNSSCRLLDLLKKLQNKFSNSPPSYESELDHALQQFDNYNRQVQSLRTKPPGTQPPPPPQINLENTLKTFEYQENLMAQCEQKNSLYMMTAQQYNQNLAKVRVMSQKFSKGKIIRQMQKSIENEIHHHQYGSVLTLVQSYYENRKKLHKMKMLKQLYQES